MDKKSKHAILGAGGGGQVFAADLALRGHEVNVFDLPEFCETTIKPIEKQGGIYLTTEAYVGDAVPTGFAHVKATTKMQEAIDGVDVIHIVVPAYAQNRFFKELAPHLKGEQIVVTHPGYLGSLELSKMLNKQQREEVTLAETKTMLYNARNKGPGHAWAFGIKQEYPVAAFPGKKTGKVVAAMKEAFPFPHIFPFQNVLETYLNITAIVAHPSILLNTGWVECTKGAFRFWHDGMTPSVARVIETMDSERTAIQEAFGFEKISLADWLKRLYSHYGAKGNTAREVWLNCRNYELGYTPKSIGGKEKPITYVDQDVPYGLMSMISIGNLAGVPTPCAKVIADLACMVNGIDYWKEARTLENLGLAKLGKEQLLKYFEGETTA